MSRSRRILIIDGHPDPDRKRFVHALASAYAAAATDAGHAVERIDVAESEFPVIRSEHEWKSTDPPVAIQQTQNAVERADHIVIIYPLWLGDVPALLKAFLEQTFRPGFAFDESDTALFKRKLAGRSARLIVTMGMPGLAYRLFYCGHSLRSLARNVFKFVGFAPVKKTVFGSVGTLTEERARKYLAVVRDLGRAGN